VAGACQVLCDKYTGNGLGAAYTHW
jgi:hypothetical protein